MRSQYLSRIAFFILAMWMAASMGLGDVIYLKNGRKISGSITREDSEHIYYAWEGGEITIPRSLIDHVVKSPVSSGSSSTTHPSAGSDSSKGHQLPLLPLPQVTGYEADSASQTVRNGQINTPYLQHLDDEVLSHPTPENRNRLKRGYEEAALFHTRNGDPESAIEDYRHALTLLPHDLALTLGLGYLLVKENHNLEAVDLLLPASDAHPHSADIHVLLGSAFYGEEDLGQAITEWNKALEIRNSPQVRQAVNRAKLEQKVSGSYQELRTEHFLIRYDASEPREFIDEVSKTLEAVFTEIESDLDYYPAEPIIVLLYPKRAFRDITRSPSWVGAVNDGKIRVPVSGLTTMTAELARVLKHESTHSFVRQMTMGRCPMWFNEGLAQLEDGSTTVAFGTRLAHAMAAGQLPPYSDLETSFLNLPQNEVGLVYAKSLAALEYLRDTQGMGEIRRLLRAMPSIPNFNVLLQKQLRLNYSSFEQEVVAYIGNRYGI